MRRLAFLAVVLLGAVVAVVAGCGAGGSAVSSQTYRVDAIFDNAAFLIPGNDVRIAGANVGSVTAVKVTPDQKARISMEIDERFAPFRSDADCFIAPQSLIGERFMQCAPGTPRGRELKGDPPTVPVTNTHSPVDPDLVTASMTLPVRERLSIVLNELGAGLAGNGEALSAAIRRANPAIQATQDVLHIVDRDRSTLGRLVDRSDQVIGQLAQRRDRVASFIQEASDVADTAARRDGNISEGIRRLPDTLDETRASLSALRTLAQRSRPLLGELRKAAGPLDRLTGDVPPLADAARPALKHLATMSRTGTQTLREGRPVVKRLRTFADLAVPAGDLATELNESLRDRGVVEGIQTFLYQVALTISRYDKDSHLQPSYLVSVADCALFAETTSPSCDAHLTPGSATTRAERKARRRHRSRARHHRRTQAHRDAPAQQESRGDRPASKGPVGDLVDKVTETVGKLPPLPKAPPLPKVPDVPQVAPPPKKSDPTDLLDYLLGS